MICPLGLLFPYLQLSKAYFSLRIQLKYHLGKSSEDVSLDDVPSHDFFLLLGFPGTLHRACVTSLPYMRKRSFKWMTVGLLLKQGIEKLRWKMVGSRGITGGISMGHSSAICFSGVPHRWHYACESQTILLTHVVSCKLESSVFLPYSIDCFPNIILKVLVKDCLNVPFLTWPYFRALKGEQIISIPSQAFCPHSPPDSIRTHSWILHGGCAITHWGICRREREMSESKSLGS